MNGPPGSARSALVAAVLGLPDPRLPDLESRHLDRFWEQFARSAPAHLRVAFSGATFVLAVALPRLLGHSRSLPGLPAADAIGVIERADALPALGPLVETAKLVAAMAYLSDPKVDRVFREPR